MTPGWRPVALALTLVACATSTRPAHDVALTEVAARASAVVAPLPAPSYRVPVDDSPVVIEQAHALLRECPKFFSLDESAECSASFEPWCFDPLASTRPADPNESAEVPEPLSASERLERAHTALRLTMDASPEMAAVGRFLLASYTPMIRGGDPTDSLCANAGLARGLFEMLERLDALGEKTASDRHSSSQLTMLGVCGDIDAPGLLGRWQALARRQIARSVATPDDDGLIDSTWLATLAQQPVSVARRRMFIEALEAFPPGKRGSLISMRLSRIGPITTVDDEFCAMAERHLTSDDPDENAWAPQVFLIGECMARHDVLVSRLRSRLDDRASLTIGTLRTIQLACYHGPVEGFSPTQAFDALRPLASPQNGDDALRAQALRSACQCDAKSARPLVRQARQSRSAAVREAANSGVCQN